MIANQTRTAMGAGESSRRAVRAARAFTVNASALSGALRKQIQMRHAMDVILFKVVHEIEKEQQRCFKELLQGLAPSISPSTSS